MMSRSDLIAWLIFGFSYICLTYLFLLVARTPTRRYFGSQVTYLLWTLIPAGLLSALLPQAESIFWQSQGTQIAGSLSRVIATQAATQFDWQRTTLVVWLFGCALTSVRFVLLQREFILQIGPLTKVGNIFVSASTLGLPATIGLFRPKIVVPADFDTRYTLTERMLMLEHERAHIRRGDLFANSIALILRCLFWFHPLLPSMAKLLRSDQELACDAATLALHPNSRRTYGEAMLKTLTAARPVPLSCHWGNTQPIRERFKMLNQKAPRLSMKILGISLVALAGIGGAAVGWAASPSNASPANTQDSFRLNLDVTFANGVTKSVAMKSRYGKQLGFSSDEGGSQFSFFGVVTRTAQGNMDLEGILEENGHVLSRPHVIGKAGSAMTIKTGDLQQDGTFSGTTLKITIN
jgi:bla regulator protein blaR1